MTSAMASRVMSSWVGARPAAADHGAGPLEGGVESRDHAGVVVADLGLVEAGDAGGGQMLAYPRRVSVDHLAHEQLAAYGQDLAVHPPP